MKNRTGSDNTGRAFAALLLFLATAPILFGQPPVDAEWATFFGNAGEAQILDVEATSNGDVIVNGFTTGSTLPTGATPLRMLGSPGGKSAFVARIAGDGSTVQWVNIIGNVGTEVICRVAVDAADNIYVAGGTSTGLGIASPAPVAPYTSGNDAFVAKFDFATGDLIWYTYVGSTGNDSGEGIAVSSTHNQVILGGTTNSTSLPLQHPAFGNSGGNDAYCARLDATTGQLLWTAQIGSAGDDRGWGGAIDQAGNAFVTGRTASDILVTAPNNGYGTLNGGGELICAKFNQADGSVQWYTRVGNEGTEIGWEVEVNSRNEALIAGHSAGTENVFGQPFAVLNTSKAMLVSLNGGDGTLLYNLLYGSAGDIGEDLEVDADDNIYLTGSTFSTDLFTVNPALRGPGYDPVHGGHDDIFLTKFLDQGGATPIIDWQTFYNTARTDTITSEKAYGVSVANDGSIYLGGYAYYSADFEVFNSPIQPVYGGIPTDGVIVKLSQQPPPPGIGGRVFTEAGQPILNVNLALDDGSTIVNQTTPADGTYLFDNLANQNYTVTPTRNIRNTNGIDIDDAQAVLQHFLGNDTLSQYKVIAADINNDGSVDVTDVICITRYYSGVDAALMAPPWQFVPASFVLPATPLDSVPPFPEQATYTPLNGFLINEDFIGVKTGDVNCTADPQQ